MRKCCQRFTSINQKHYLDLGSVLVLVNNSSGKTVLARLYWAVSGRFQLLAHKSHSLNGQCLVLRRSGTRENQRKNTVSFPVSEKCLKYLRSGHSQASL